MTRTTRTARPRSHRRLAVAATAAPRVAPRGLLCQGSGGSLAPYSRREGRWPLRPRAVYCFSEGRDCGRSLPMSGWEQGGRWRRDEEERASRSQEDTMVIYLDLFFLPWVLCFWGICLWAGSFFPTLSTWDSHFRRKLTGLFFLVEEMKLWAEVAKAVAWRRGASDEGGSQREQTNIQTRKDTVSAERRDVEDGTGE